MTFPFKFGSLMLALLLGAAPSALAQATGGANAQSGANTNATTSGAGGTGSTASSSSGSGARKVRTKVTPEYPALARQVNVTGKVKISATVSAEGRVVATRILGGSPLLTEAANNAVKQWRYEPTGRETTEIVEVEFSGK